MTQIETDHLRNEAEGENAIGDLADLLLRMRPRVTWIGFKRGEKPTTITAAKIQTHPLSHISLA